MRRKVRNFYRLLTAGCLIGYGWVIYNLYDLKWSHYKVIDACFIHHFTGFPCPACGSTRSVLAIIQAQFKEALMINPLGYLIAVILLLLPLCLIYDYSTHQIKTYRIYRKGEHVMRKPYVAVTLGMLVLINWIWNFGKLL